MRAREEKAKEPLRGGHQRCSTHLGCSLEFPLAKLRHLEITNMSRPAAISATEVLTQRKNLNLQQEDAPGPLLQQFNPDVLERLPSADSAKKVRVFHNLSSTIF